MNKAFIVAIIGSCIGMAGLGQLFRGQVVAGLVINTIGLIFLLSMIFTMGITLIFYIGLCVYCINDTRKELPMD